MRGMPQVVGTHWGAAGAGAGLSRNHVGALRAVEHEIEHDFGSTCLRHHLPLVLEGERGQYLCDRQRCLALMEFAAGSCCSH